MKDVEDFIVGIQPVAESILRLAGDIQGRGLVAEKEAKDEVSFSHEETAFMVRTLQAFSGLFAQMATIVENQAHEIRVSSIRFPDEAKPKLILQ